MVRYRQFYEGRMELFGLLEEGVFTCPRSSLFNKYPPMQYTGVYDMKGVEICTGDILLLRGKNEHNKPVVYINGMFGVKSARGNVCALSSLVSFNRRFEVIGNTYENPELLPND